MRVQCENGNRLAKRIVFLAWQACGGAFGMGALQDRGAQPEESVWQSAYNRTDYPGGRKFPKLAENEIDCDYVQGRMMKFGLKFGDDFVDVRCSQPQPDYQAWCRKYKTVEALVNAAVESLEKEAVAA